MKKLEDLIADIEEVKMYECPICEALFDSLLEATDCVRDCHETGECFDIRKLKELTGKSLTKDVWCPSCQKKVNATFNNRKLKDDLYIELICSECDRTINFWGKE